ncbi:MAG: type II/IV secretion system protein, partial [Deltaproteobacteria bacterium]|nr:type II/IV secretion system protein [Deltaproteobacteria bacterium]
MNNIQPIGQSEIETKFKEAETCHSMGMPREALQVYEQILASLPGKDGQIRKTVVAKIDFLKKDIEDQEEAENQGFSEEDISIFKKTLSSHDDVPTLLDGAAALKELGLMEEAIAEYEKLLEFDYSKFNYSEADYSPTKIICDYLTCLLDVKQPQDVVKTAYKVIYKQNIQEKETAQLKFWLGLQLDRKDHFDLAYDLYEAAASIDPSHTEAIERLNALKARISTSSRYDYLIRNKIVTTNQLQEALAITKKMNKSVEFVLVDRFGVKKEDVGKSLSQYFGCPFRDFDEEFPIPFELIGKLKKSFLLYYVWVPLSWSKKGVEILVDDPKDLRKTDHIKALMPNQKIIFSVGLKEDIDKYIAHFFDPRAETTTTNDFDDLDDIIPDVTFEEEEEIEEDIRSLDESSSQVVKFVDQVLITAFRNDASDIHIEPSPLTRKTTIRFRTDGVCHEYIQVPNTMAPA